MTQSIPNDDVIDVVCIVLVDPAKRILVTQRANDGVLGGKWEFPGGKVEKGEDHEDALRRELREELCLEVGDLSPLTPVIHAYDSARIRLLPFLSRCEIHPDLTLVEHADFLWASFEKARPLDWAPADLPILAQLEKLPW